MQEECLAIRKDMQDQQAQAHFLESVNILQAMNEKSLLPDVLCCLGYAHRSLGDRACAMQTMVQALDLVIETGPLNPMRFELPGMALLLADAGEQVRAVELYAAAQQSPYIANSRWFEDFAGKSIAHQIKIGRAYLRGGQRRLADGLPQNQQSFNRPSHG